MKINKTKVLKLLNRISEKCLPYTQKKKETTAGKLVLLYKEYAIEELKELKAMGVDYEYLNTHGFLIACICGIPLAIDSLEN